MSELRADFEKRLRDPATGIEATQYLRGVLDGIEKILSLPESEIRNQQRIAEAEAKRDVEEASAGVWPTRALRSRLPRFRAGGQ